VEKNKTKWIKEWRIAVVVFEQLQNDCTKLKMVEAIEEYEVLANKIVKDQLGLEKCLENLNRVINKYNNTMKLAMDIEESDAEFYRHMNESIQKLRKNTQILLKSR